MEIKRNVNDTEMSFELTNEEMRATAAETIHGILMEMAPSALTRGIMNKGHASAEAMEEAYGTTLEEMLHPGYLNHYVVVPAIEMLDCDTSINAALKAVIDKHLSLLPVIKKVNEHIETFEDNLVSTCDTFEDELNTDRAERAVEISEVVSQLVKEEAKAAGEDDVDAFCEKKYGHTLTSLLNAENPFYIPLFGAELSIIIEGTGVGEVDLAAIARICLNILKDEMFDYDGGSKELYLETSIVLHFISRLAEMTGKTPDDITHEFYGCSVADAFDPENENYILIPVEDDEDDDDCECECEGDDDCVDDDECCCCECDCKCCNDEAMPIFEFLMRTVLGHVKEEADDDLVMLAMQIAAISDPSFPVHEWPSCDVCGLPVFPCEVDGPETYDMNGDICPVCGQPVEGEYEVECCRCGDCDCECCDDEDDDEDDGTCPICGRSLDEFPAEPEDGDDPDQMSLYDK